METASENIKECVRFEFRTSGGFFNQEHFKLRSQTVVQAVRDQLVADDCACVDHKLEDIEWIGNKISRAFKTFGLTICIKS